MATGPEMLMNALIKGLGLDPRQFIQQIQTFVGVVNTKLTQFTESAASINDRLERLERTQIEMTTKLDLILAYHQGRVIEHGQAGYVNGHRAIDISNPTDASTKRPDPHDAGGGNEPA